jgi:hypothetical protein
MFDMNITSPINITRSCQICVAVGTSKTKTEWTEAVYKTTIILIPKGLKIMSYFSRYLSGEYIYRVFTKEWCGFKNLLKDYILQLNGAPPHFHRTVRELLNRVLQQRWIGLAANGDNYIHIPYGTNSIIMWMCVVWPRVHKLKDYD